jgi:hypothetical protein
MAMAQRLMDVAATRGCSSWLKNGVQILLEKVAQQGDVEDHEPQVGAVPQVEEDDEVVDDHGQQHGHEGAEGLAAQIVFGQAAVAPRTATA